MRNGAKEFLSFPLSLEDFLAALDRIQLATGGSSGGSPNKASQVVTVSGVSGGVGCTSLAINLACVLAQDQQNNVAIIDLDLSLGDANGLEVVDTIIDGSPDTQIIIMTGYPSIQSAIDALRRGAQDYIIKPFKMPEIHAAVARSLKNQRLEAEVRQLRRKVRDQEHEILQLKTKSGGPVAGRRQPGPAARPAGLPGAYGGAPPAAPAPEADPAPPSPTEGE